MIDQQLMKGAPPGGPLRWSMAWPSVHYLQLSIILNFDLQGRLPVHSPCEHSF